MSGIILGFLAFTATVCGLSGYIGYAKGYERGWQDRSRVRLDRRSITRLLDDDAS